MVACLYLLLGLICREPLRYSARGLPMCMGALPLISHLKQQTRTPPCLPRFRLKIVGPATMKAQGKARGKGNLS